MKSHQEVAQEQGEEDMAQVVADILFPEPRRDGNDLYVSDDAIDNLQGAIDTLNIAGGPAGIRCVNTLERIRDQLVRVHELVKK